MAEYGEPRTGISRAFTEVLRWFELNVRPALYLCEWYWSSSSLLQITALIALLLGPMGPIGPWAARTNQVHPNQVQQHLKGACPTLESYIECTLREAQQARIHNKYPGMNYDPNNGV